MLMDKTLVLCIGRMVKLQDLDVELRYPTWPHMAKIRTGVEIFVQAKQLRDISFCYVSATFFFSFFLFFPG